MFADRAFDRAPARVARCGPSALRARKALREAALIRLTGPLNLAGRPLQVN
jgi:hypothetical protein